MTSQSALNAIGIRGVSKNAARLTAGFVAAIALGTALSGWTWVGFLLALDFLPRALGRPKFSPLGRLSGLILSSAKVPDKMVDAAPKVFAARLGLGLTLVIGLLGLGGQFIVPQIMAGMLAVLAGLECGAGFCLACRIYPLVFRVRHTRHYGKPLDSKI